MHSLDEKSALALGHGARLPALDGVRGLALAMVMVMHSTTLPKAAGGLFQAVNGLAHGGWMGVDLFFVLSGFLITGILFDSKGSAHYFRNFYARRGLRIFPLYYAFVIVFLVIVPGVHQFSAHAGGVQPSDPISWTFWLFCSNFATALGPGDGHFGYLSVLWSLAVEEHFYLVWPLVVCWCERRTLMRVCGGLVVTALLARIALSASGQPYRLMYMLTPCRMDALAIGSFVALAVRGSGGAKALLPLARRLAALSAVVIVACCAWHRRLLWTSGGPGQTIGYTAVAIFFASMLVHVLNAKPQSLITRLFAGRTLTTLGRYSYAMYLLHCPVGTLLAKYLCNDQGVRPLLGSALLGQLVYTAGCFGVTLAAALVTWHLLEKHCLKLKGRFAPSAPKAKKARVDPVRPIVAEHPAAPLRYAVA